MKSNDTIQDESSWGGKRTNAGRKPAAVKGKNLWIPAACLDEVNKILEDYSNKKKSDEIYSLIIRTKVASPAKPVKPVKSFEEQIELSISPAPTLSPVPVPVPVPVPAPMSSHNSNVKPRKGFKATELKQLDRLPRDVKRKLIRDFGGLYHALVRGVWIDGHKAYVYEN